METDSYGLVLTGTIRPGFDAAQVWPALAAYLCIEPEKLTGSILARAPLTIKESPDLAKLQTLQAGIGAAGADAELVTLDGEDALFVLLQDSARGPVPHAFVAAQVAQGDLPVGVQVAAVGKNTWGPYVPRTTPAAVTVALAIEPLAALGDADVGTQDPARVETIAASAPPADADDCFAATATNARDEAAFMAVPVVEGMAGAEPEIEPEREVAVAAPRSDVVDAFTATLKQGVGNAAFVAAATAPAAAVDAAVDAAATPVVAPGLAGHEAPLIAATADEAAYLPASAAVNAGFWRRAAAQTIDGALLLGVALLVVFAGADAGADANVHWASLQVSSTTQVLLLVIALLYFAGFESSPLQATPGKRAMGLKVTDLRGRRIAFGRAVGRYLGKILSALVFFAGYLLAGWTARKQALHDLLADSLVVFRTVSADAPTPAARAPMPWYGWLLNVILLGLVAGVVASIGTAFAVLNNL